MLKTFSTLPITITGLNKCNIFNSYVPHTILHLIIIIIFVDKILALESWWFLKVNSSTVQNLHFYRETISPYFTDQRVPIFFLLCNGYFENSYIGFKSVKVVFF